VPGDAAGGIDLAEGSLEPGGAAEHRVFPGNDGGGAGLAGRDQLGSEVAGRYVFGQGGIHITFNFGGGRQLQGKVLGRAGIHGGLSFMLD